MEKTCPLHGKFEIKIAKYAWYYRGLEDYRDSLFSEDFYKKHNPTRRYVGSINSRCNLNCPVCFSDHIKSKLEDASIDFLKAQLERLKNRGLSICFSGGGEPTLSEDLPKRISLVKKSGNYPAIFTNGIKIAHDFEYLKLLKEHGLATAYLWMDTVKNPEVYQKLRRGNFIDSRIRAIENIKKMNIPLRIVAVIVRGINESEIGDLIEFAKKEKSIRTLFLFGYNCLGESHFSPSQEFLLDELIESVAEQSHNLFPLEDIFYHQKLYITLEAIRQRSPHCSQAALLDIPRGKEKFLHHIFRVNKFSPVLDKFEKIWQEDQGRAKKYLLLKCLPKILTTPDLYYLLGIMKTRTNFNTPIPSFFHNHYYRLLIATSYNNATFDSEAADRNCNARSLNPGVENNVPLCYYEHNFYRKSC